jgi:mono/diheme cytochrome c family protein
MKRALFAAAAALLLLSAAAQEKKPSESRAQEAKPAEESKIPAEAAQKPNPVKPTEASIEAGKKFFSTQCVMCHGKEGDGKGDLAQEMELKLRDYRQPDALKGFTDGELFYILTNGRGKMPGQGNRMPEEQKWNVVNYLRSLAKARNSEHPPAKP